MQSLGEYNNEVARLSLHIDMASNINALTSNMKLDEIGLLEQDLIYGTSSSKQVIEMLSQRQDLHEIDKVAPGL